VILIFCISFFSFYVIKLQFIGYIFLLSIWLFCILISIVAIVKSINNKKNYFLNYILLISILFAFLGEVHVDYLYNYLEKEMLFIVNSIENYYGNKKYNASEIKNLLEIYEYKKIGTYYNDPNNGFYFIGIRRLHGKPLMNLSFYMNDDYYIISGITQILGIPYMEYDSREKTVNRNKVGNYLLYKKIL
jgi:hypothetical protein